MRALVTGINGFIGANLATFLRQKNVSVAGLVRSGKNLAPALRKQKILKGTGSLFSPKALSGYLARFKPTHVFHMAGSHGSASEADVVRDNIVGTMNLFKAVKASGQKIKIVVLGSSAEYGNGTNRKISETANVSPLTFYGKSKAMMSYVSQEFGKKTGMAVVVARPFNVVGPGQKEAFVCSRVAKQLAEIEKGRQKPVITLGNLSTKRDFVDVRDLVQGLYDLAKKGKSGEIYNLCSGRATPVAKAVKQLIQMSKKPVRVVQAEKKRLKGNVSSQKGSYSKIHRLSGWKPSVNLEDSLSDLLADWRKKVGVRN